MAVGRGGGVTALLAGQGGIGLCRRGPGVGWWRLLWAWERTTRRTGGVCQCWPGIDPESSLRGDEIYLYLGSNDIFPFQQPLSEREGAPHDCFLQCMVWLLFPSLHAHFFRSFRGGQESRGTDMIIVSFITCMTSFFFLPCDQEFNVYFPSFCAVKNFVPREGCRRKGVWEHSWQDYGPT